MVPRQLYSFRMKLGYNKCRKVTWPDLISQSGHYGGLSVESWFFCHGMVVILFGIKTLGHFDIFLQILDDLCTFLTKATVYSGTAIQIIVRNGEVQFDS